MTSTLAAISGIPAAIRADGTQIYVERCPVTRANLARCPACGYILTEGTFWGLQQSSWLHTQGHPQCRKAKITYWRYL